MQLTCLTRDVSRECQKSFFSQIFPDNSLMFIQYFPDLHHQNIISEGTLVSPLDTPLNQQGI